MKRNEMALVVVAILLVVLGFVTSLAAGFTILYMWFSKSFLPIRIAGEYLWYNQAIRYILYSILIIGFFTGVVIVDEETTSIVDSFKRKFGR